MIGVPTGFIELDELTNGLHPGQMIVIAARPAVGKSTLGIDIARAAAIKHNLATAVFSLEMSRTEITMRMLSAEARDPAAGPAQGPDERRRLDQARPRSWARSPTARCSSTTRPNMSLMEIRAKCRRLKQRHDLKLVIIDYLQLMSSGKRVESPPAGGRRSSPVRSSCSPRSSRSRSSRSASSTVVPSSAPTSDRRCPTFANRAASPRTRGSCAPTPAPRSTMGELFATGATDVPVWALDDQLRYVPPRT